MSKQDTKRPLPYDGGANAFAIAKGVQSVWHIREKAGEDSPLLCRSVEVRSMVFGMIFGRKIAGARLAILDPKSGQEVVLPQD